MTLFRSAWVLPIASPPIRDGWIECAGDRVVRLGGPADQPPGEVRDLGRVVMLPGLINAHTHLELSHLRGLIPPSSSFITWVRQLMPMRRAFPDADDPRILDGVASGIREAVDTG